MGSTEDYMKRLLTRRNKDIPAEFEAISSEKRKLQKRRELLKKEIFDLDLEIDSLNKRSNEKTFLDLPVLVLQMVATFFGQPDELFWKLSLVSPLLSSVITQTFQQKVETAIEEKSFSLLIENNYLDEADIQNMSNSRFQKVEILAEKCWRFLEEPCLSSIQFEKTDDIKAFLDKAHQAKIPCEIFSRKSFEFDWGIQSNYQSVQKQQWDSFTAATTSLLGSFRYLMPNVSFNYRQNSNTSNFTDTVIATMPTLQRITKRGSVTDYACVATKYEPRTLEKLHILAAPWSSKEKFELHLPDLGICRQFALGQVVLDSKCFRTLRTLIFKDTTSGEVSGYEIFHNEALTENIDNMENLRISSNLNVKDSLSFASKFKYLSHLSLMLRQGQHINETSLYEFPSSTLLPRLKSFTINYDCSRKIVPLIQFFAVFPSIRNFQLEAVNLTKMDLMKEMKHRLASDARKSTEIHIVNLYHKYSEGLSPAASNIWTLYQNLLSVTFTTVLQKKDNRISGRRGHLIEKYIRTESTKSNPRIVQSTSSKICDSNF